MRRLLSFAAVWLILVAGPVSSVAAQDSATPTAGEGDSAVIIYGSDGQPEGELVVESITEPYEEYESSYAPKRGFHYVMAVVTITATGNRPLEASSYGFGIVDTDGFRYSTTYIYRQTAATEALPDFAGGTLEPGQSMTGAVFFEALDGTTTGLVIYQPSFDRLITGGDLREALVAEGDPVNVLASDGSPAATITIDGTVVPLEDYASPPQRGFQFVGVTVTIENTSSRPFEIDPYDFALTDAEGFVYNSYGVYRTAEAEASEPSLQYGAELAAGDSVTGLLSFQMLAGTEIGVIYYAPGSDRHVRLAEYADGQAPKPGDTPPSAGRSNPGGDETPVSEATTVVIQTTPGCEGALEWAMESIGYLNDWTEIIISVQGVTDGQAVDAETVREAAGDAEALADAQRDVDVPTVANDANDLLIDLYDDTAAALNDLADATDGGNEVEIKAAQDAFALLGDVADEGSEMDTVFTALGDECPELESL